MRGLGNWIQWTVVFLVLTAGSWLAYPEIDPFGGKTGLSLIHRIREDALSQAGPNLPKEGHARTVTSLLSATR
jgi:hypothetical protein